MSKPFSHKYRKGMDEPEKTYKEIQSEYERRMAPIRSKRAQEARKRLKALKLQKPYITIAKNQINPWIP